jgi:hypothetical protein
MEKELFLKDSPMAGTFPLMIQPGSDGKGLVEWIQANRSGFEQDLENYGGILLRGFGVRTAEDFNLFMKCFNTDPLPYMFRSSPRQELDSRLRNIYLSTSYPNERRIEMHSESSYSRVWGRKIVFCCLQPAEEGGETPIADTRKVLKEIKPELVEKFRQKGVKYRRNLLPDLGMPWQEVFQTTDKAVAGSICLKYNITHTFKDKDHMVIEWTKPAVYRHPVSGVETWFNHILFFNKFSRYEELGLAHDEDFPDEWLTSNTYFGDGSEISYDEYLDIRNAYRKNTIVIPYRQGDIIFLDNMLAAHGRNPYKGDRVIATAIIEATFDAGYSINI